MTQPDIRLATALQAASSFAVATPTTSDRWAGNGRRVETLSPFATQAGGEAEAARVAALFDAPLVRDRVVVPGRVRDLTRRCIWLKADGLDYPRRGALVIVLGTAEQENGTTVLTVLRRLG